MSLFDKINARISENLQHYGHYLTDPHASEEEKIAETSGGFTRPRMAAVVSGGTRPLPKSRPLM